MTLALLELFSGLGGWRMAGEGFSEVKAAYDISPHANEAYLLNHGDRPLARELARVKGAELRAWGADTWVMSPPCQPFCRMGNRLDLEDPRSQAFVALMGLLGEAPPMGLVLESVEGFLGSGAHALLRRVLEDLGFHALEFRLCPSAFGLPNLRPRVYVAASRRPLRPLSLPAEPPGRVGDYLDPVEDPVLYLEGEALRHRAGLDLVRDGDRRTACFIGGYGRKYVGSGSCLLTPLGIRRFSPSEVARLMGMAPLRFPPGMALETRYKLLGNGLSIPVARWVLRHLLSDTN